MSRVDLNEPKQKGGEEMAGADKKPLPPEITLARVKLAGAAEELADKLAQLNKAEKELGLPESERLSEDPLVREIVARVRSILNPPRQ